MNTTFAVVQLGRSGGTTASDLSVTARFVFGRPGWAVEERFEPSREAFLLLTIIPPAGGQPVVWKLQRTPDGVLATNDLVARPLGRFTTARDALVAIWEASTSDAREPEPLLHRPPARPRGT